MLRILDSSLNLLAVFDKVLICKTREVLNAEGLLNFTVTVDKSKSQYLYNKGNILVVDDNYYKVYRLKEIHKVGQSVTIDIQAEQVHYNLIDSKMVDFSMTDTINNIGSKIVTPNGFSFSTDFTETVELNVEGEATRQALLIALANKCTGEIKYDKYHISLMKSIGTNRIYAKFGNNVNEVTREKDFSNDTTNYSINLIDTSNPNLKDLKRANLGDIVIVTDDELGINLVEKKVIEIERDHILRINTKVALGDPGPRIIEAIKKNINVKVNNVITEVIHQQVINVETAHILNAWIKNLFVEYVETNMDARLDRSTVDRHFIRIENEREEMVWQTLDINEVEPLLIKDPRGSGMINVYYTSIGEHPDAYRYFTITNPKSIHKDITDAEVDAFKVMVKKITNANGDGIVKYSKAFKKVKLTNSSETETPVETWGAGTDPTGLTPRGKFEAYKGQEGMYWIQHNEVNGNFTGLRFNGVTCAIEYFDQVNNVWRPLINQFVGGMGQVVLHADKAHGSLTTADLIGGNALHMGYSTTGANVVGTASTLYLDGLSVLGVEAATVLPPVEPLPLPPGEIIYLYYYGNENVEVTGGWTRFINDGSKSNGITNNSTVVKGQHYMYSINNHCQGMDANGGFWCAVGTQNKIDLTPYKYLCIEIENTISVDKNYSSCWACGTVNLNTWSDHATMVGNVGEDTPKAETPKPKRILKVDISNVTGQYIISWRSGHTTTRCTGVWLEKPPRVTFIDEFIDNRYGWSNVVTSNGGKLYGSSFTYNNGVYEAWTGITLPQKMTLPIEIEFEQHTRATSTRNEIMIIFNNCVVTSNGTNGENRQVVQLNNINWGRLMTQYVNPNGVHKITIDVNGAITYSLNGSTWSAGTIGKGAILSNISVGFAKRDSSSADSSDYLSYIKATGVSV